MLVLCVGCVGCVSRGIYWCSFVEKATSSIVDVLALEPHFLPRGRRIEFVVIHAQVVVSGYDMLRIVKHLDGFKSSSNTTITVNNLSRASFYIQMHVVPRSSVPPIALAGRAVALASLPLSL